jgi:hypothetical protein
LRGLGGTGASRSLVLATVCRSMMHSAAGSTGTGSHRSRSTGSKCNAAAAATCTAPTRLAASLQILTVRRQPVPRSA